MLYIYFVKKVEFIQPLDSFSFILALPLFLPVVHSALVYLFAVPSRVQRLRLAAPDP